MRYLLISFMVAATAGLAIAQTMGSSIMMPANMISTGNTVSLANNATGNITNTAHGRVVGNAGEIRNRANARPTGISTVYTMADNTANTANTANISNSTNTVTAAPTPPPEPAAPAYGDNIRTMRSDKAMFNGKPQY